MFVYAAEFCIVHAGWSNGKPAKYGFDDDTFLGKVLNVFVVSSGW